MARSVGHFARGFLTLRASIAKKQQLSIEDTVKT
jgi:hypothetical protein